MGDLAGGLIAALIALPYGLAMASLMGLPPAMGLFTSILTAPITALLGRNAVMIGGTSSVTVPFIAAAVAAQGVGGAAKVSIVAAILMMTFCVLRLGRYVSKVPLTVVSGFSCGIGALMVISQLKTVMGVAIPNGLSAMGSLFEAISRIGDIKPAPFALSAIVIVAATLSGRLFPKAPAPLLAVVAAVVLGNILGLHDKELGKLPMEIPPLAGFSWTPTDVISVLPQAFALAFVSSVNLLITSRVVEHFRGKHAHIKAADADRELGAYSIANLAAGVFGAPMSVGIPARSLANVRCGGNSRMSNIFHALFLILFLYVGSDFIAHIPVPALGRRDRLDGLLPA